jgi:GNAT superfamily N-acetyltransferase
MAELRDPHAVDDRSAVNTMARMPLPDGVSLREAIVSDAESLTELHLDCWDDAYIGLIPRPILDARREDVASRVARWQLALEEGEPTFLADHDGRLIGFASAGTGRDNDVDLRLELKALYVRGAWWGHGIGYALLWESIQDQEAYLWVLKGNHRAIGFYARHGFALDGTEDEHDEGLHVRMVRAGT